MKDEGLFFDLISFDPRGVNNTTPHLPCFPNGFALQAWLLEELDYGVRWSSDANIAYTYARAAALGRSCQRANPSNESIVRYVSTAQTAADMLEIIERHGQWREDQAARYMRRDVDSVPERLKWQKGEEKIMYWGQSYGTALGQTFATLYPSRISRMILDGVLDAEDYYAGLWQANLLDSDKIVAQYCRYCFEAGPSACPLYLAAGSEAIEERFVSILKDLKQHPIPLGSGDEGPSVVSYGDVHLYLLAALYFPTTWAEPFFHMMASIEAGRINETVLNGLKWGIAQPESISKVCHGEPFGEACLASLQYVSGLGALQSISCMDSIGAGATTQSLGDFKGDLKFMMNQSQWIATNWVQNRLACVGFDTKPAWAFSQDIGGATSHPILAIGNTYDTVTPLRNAQQIPQIFPGAKALQQDSEGHCSYSNPSLCTARYVRQYFQTGELPQNGAICEPEWRPFLGGVKHEGLDDDARLLDVLRSLEDTWAKDPIARVA